MIHTKILSKSNPTNLLKKAVNTASCYGFDSIDRVVACKKKRLNNFNEKDDNLSTKTEEKKYLKQTTKSCDMDITGDEMLCALKTAVDNELLPSEHPLLIYQSTIVNNSKEKTLNFGLIAVGIKKSIAEALILKTATTILEDIGIKDIRVHINSIGDRDSSAKFVSELNLYFRKNLNSIPLQIRQIIKKDIFKAYNRLHRDYDFAEEKMPQPIKFLSDYNRKHLSEILEYMETSSIPYEIDNFLVGDNKYYSQTLFEIRNTPENNENISVVLAKGGRYDELVRRMFNIDIPIVGIVLEFEKMGIKEKKLNTTKNKKPKIYFIQLGSEAKRKSLYIIDILRKSNIYTHHSLDNDKLSEQLSFAQYLKVPYAIIMGHREALDGTVIVRNMDTQFQHIVLIDELPKYLKEIPI